MHAAVALRAAGTQELSFSVETLTDERSFERLGPEWERLFGSLSMPTPFLQHGWLLEWWRHYGRGTELAVHVARRNGALVGALPFCVESRLGVRVAHGLWTMVERLRSRYVDLSDGWESTYGRVVTSSRRRADRRRRRQLEDLGRLDVRVVTSGSGYGLYGRLRHRLRDAVWGAGR